MVCAICKIRRPRRYCPAVRGEICTVCCGTEREVTITCPFDCLYLQESRLHEKTADILELPNADIRVTEEMIVENEPLLISLAGAIFRGAMATPGVVDYDVREAVDALVRTYRTLQSGIYFETRPTNPLAAAIFDAVQLTANNFRETERRDIGLARTRDADILAILVFLQNLEYTTNNGRKRGRAFLDSLRGIHGEVENGGSPASTSSIILP